MEKERFCKICGSINCKKHSTFFENVRIISEFSGSSPPEVFVGKWNYPNVYLGILSPQEYGNTEILSSQELWHKNRLSIPEITNLRSKLIYGRTQSNIKKALNSINKSKFISTMQEIAMTSKPVGTEFKLEKGIQENLEKDNYTPIIKNAALVKSVRLEENPFIEKKVEYLTSDTDAEAITGMIELEKARIPTSSIIKILSAGLLGLNMRRKFVPTRWAITAVDDTLSKEKLKKIKYFSEISDIQLFNAEYLGNNYHFLLIPDKFSFEVIEINQDTKNFWYDYESFFGRKEYAKSVTGAYYANRLALCEYLEKIKKQCSCIVFREISSEYTSMGVGILRQISREAFDKAPETFLTIEEAIQKIKSKIKLPIEEFTNKSKILQNLKKQTRISKWLTH
jgi:hypothetical protein